MTRTERLRRVLGLCRYFMRNLAYFDAGRRGRSLRIKTPLWSTISDNFYDVCVLEWCKLFADPRDSHYWANIVTDPRSFERELYGRIVIAPPTFAAYRKALRHYRDKFVAHLDDDRVMGLANMDVARAAAEIYYSRVLASEVKRATARAFPKELDRYYSECYYEALDVYLQHASRVPGRKGRQAES
jgi:hypothetical protein